MYTISNSVDACTQLHQATPQALSCKDRSTGMHRRLVLVLVLPLVAISPTMVAISLYSTGISSPLKHDR